MWKTLLFSDASDPHRTEITERMRPPGSVSNGRDTRCSGMASNHLFNADSRVVMEFSSHRFPTQPRRAFDLFVEYYVLWCWLGETQQLQ